MHAIDLHVVCIVCFYADIMNGQSILICSRAVESDALCICTLGLTHALHYVTLSGGKNLFIYVRSVVTNPSPLHIKRNISIQSVSAKYKDLILQYCILSSVLPFFLLRFIAF
jgi:hypothetical protein